MITNNDIQQFENALQQFAVFFRPLTVTLKSGGTVEAKAHIGLRSTGGGMRSARVDALTGGLDQEVRLCVIMSDDWDAKSPGRPPRKGDQVYDPVLDRTWSFQRIHAAAPAGNKMLYKAELKG